MARVVSGTLEVSLTGVTAKELVDLNGAGIAFVKANQEEKGHTFSCNVIVKSASDVAALEGKLSRLRVILHTG